MSKSVGILDEEIKSFLMDNAEDMQKVLIQEIRDKFVEKIDNKIVWKQGFRVRLQEINEIEDKHKQSIKEAYEYLIGHFCSCTNSMRLRWEECDDCHQIKEIFKDKFAYVLTDESGGENGN
jgi:predicted RNA-binding protein with RPS1 domain